MLGQGKFGSVVRATVSSQTGPLPCNTQVIAPLITVCKEHFKYTNILLKVIPRMEDEHHRKNMLKDLDTAIKVAALNDS